jgi:hypothetical protein
MEDVVERLMVGYFVRESNRPIASLTKRSRGKLDGVVKIRGGWPGVEAYELFLA